MASAAALPVSGTGTTIVSPVERHAAQLPFLPRQFLPEPRRDR